MKRRKRVNPVSKKTRTQRWPVLKSVREHVLARARGLCEYRAEEGLWHHGPIDCDHVVNRSQKRDDSPDNCVALCRKHHDDKIRPFAKGRLVITSLGEEKFRFEVVTMRDKFAVRSGATHSG